jgi:mono/diheme cytochrome c family protein
MKHVGIGIVLTLLVLGMLPFALIARSRASQSDVLPQNVIADMDKQSKFRPQHRSAMYADERAMRPQVPNTIAREDMVISAEWLDDIAGTKQMTLSKNQAHLQLDDPTTFAEVTMGRIRPANTTDEAFAALTKTPPANEQAIAADDKYYVRRIPAVFTVNEEFLHRGQERFNIYCAPCHGESGYGDGPVAKRAEMLQKQPDAINGWTVPQNFQEAKIIARPDGSIFNTITNGIRNMPAYDKQVSIPDRWAIIAYLRALERSQNALPGDAKQ